MYVAYGYAVSYTHLLFPAVLSLVQPHGHVRVNSQTNAVTNQSVRVTRPAVTFLDFTKHVKLQLKKEIGQHVRSELAVSR